MTGSRVIVTCQTCKQKRSLYPSQAKALKTDLCKPCNLARIRERRTRHRSHGGIGTPLYAVWQAMRVRCGVIRGASQSWRRRYIDRGIMVYDEWANSFEAFRKWAIGAGYAESLYLDRINNDLGYEPSNCRWVTATTSARHRDGVKLSEGDVRQIKRRLEAGGTHRKVAAEFGVGKTIIGNIALGKKWRDVG